MKTLKTLKKKNKAAPLTFDSGDGVRLVLCLRTVLRV